MSTYSSDSLRRHDLIIQQPESGYRFSLDALLLADFYRCAAGAAVADLGTGCGVIPLLLARRDSEARIVGIESNPAMAGLAGENVRSNGFSDRIGIVADDILAIRSRFRVSTFDAVVSNPPFRTPQSGKVSPHAGRDAARHESSAGIHEFLSAAKYLVKPAGRIFFVYHPSRLAEFIHCAADLKLAVLRLRMVHGNRQAPAKIFLVELAKGRRGDTTVEPPLIVYDAHGEYTEEAAAILS